ncbi:MAG: hypothetical protein ACJ76N_20775 [Thermoanaerobaculia bacterium]
MKRFLFACASLVLGLILDLGALPALADAPPAAGPNFLVPQSALGSQLSPDVAQDAAGDFVVVWIDQSQTEASRLIKARLFTASGAPKSDEIAVALAGFSPRVAMTPLGDFVVAWEFFGHVYLRRFDPRGQTPLLIFDPPPNGVSHSPDVAMDPAGNAYVVWAETHTLTGDTIMLQRYGPNGFPVGAPEQVSQPGAPNARDYPRIAADPNGSLLVTWNDQRAEAGFDTDVWSRRFNAQTGTWGPEARINPDTAGLQQGSAPLLYPDGTGAVVLNDLTAKAILARHVDATGSPTADLVKLGDLGGPLPFVPSAAAGPDGSSLVAWLKGDNLVHARFFDRSWSPLGAELTLSSDRTDLETDPAVSAGGLGSFAAVWTSNGFPSPFPFFIPNGRDGSGSGVFGQAFSTLTCAAGSEVLCLEGGRFQARVSWKNPFTGETGRGRTLPLTGDTGAFWFFDPANLELMLKVLDGRAINGYFWVFYGALSNVEYTLTLTDTATGTVKTYHNPPLVFGSQADVSAFRAPLSIADSILTPEAAPLPLAAAEAETGLFAAPHCVSTPTAVCPQNRFRVEVSFVDPRNGAAGQARAVQLTNDTGIFWFFSPSNLELMVKVLDGGGVNGHFWVFYGALSDVEYTITVTDTATGSKRTYHNPLHHLASGADVDAFTAGPTAR